VIALPSQNVFIVVVTVQNGFDRDSAQHPALDGDAQLAVVEAVHARQAAADAGAS